MKSIKKYIDNIWEIPFFYKLLQGTLAAGGHNLIKKNLLKEVPKDANKILDQGCGTGEYALLFGNKYTGLDNNKDYIKRARKIYPGTFFIGDATNMKVLKNNSFDLVYAVGLHHHLPDELAKKAVKESIRVVKRGGKIVIVDAMWPKNRLNLPGLILRRMDRGGSVREVYETLDLLPKDLNVKKKVISSFPFDYIVLTFSKT